MGGVSRRRADWGRDLACTLGWQHCDLTLRELGQAADGVDYATVSAAIKRIERKLTTDQTLARTCAKAHKMIWKFDSGE